MVKDALGLIEAVGLTAAVEAADAAVKAANVKLVGYELSKGGGLVVVKLTGDVGAVKAAVEAGKSAAEKVNKVWAVHVIARPHHELEKIVMTKETVGLAAKKEAVEAVQAVEASPVSEPAEPMQVELTGEELQELDAETRLELPEEDKGEITCNLCGDPRCPRTKGEPKVTCLYYGKTKKESDEE
ncbi:BMC domain-containing protein [Azotosporobacter soli]|uniref:BMC domain-containing protein n=1 Tax=Azotosporobacter soli TaxID=3055040 RepID=UPI003D16222D